MVEIEEISRGLTTDSPILLVVSEDSDKTMALLISCDCVDAGMVLVLAKFVEEPTSLLSISLAELCETIGDSIAPVDWDWKVPKAPLLDKKLLTDGRLVLSPPRVDDGWDEDTKVDWKFSSKVDGMADMIEPLSIADEIGNSEVADRELEEMGEPSAFVVQVSGGQYP